MDIENEVNIEVNINDAEAQVETETQAAGPQGLSAYEVYVKDGGTLTEEQWLASLKGDTGATGDPGRDGVDGTDGKNLEFNWNGTQLGVRQEGQTEYQYQNLKGDTGNNGRDGYIQYTAGSNITISDENVISAAAGVKKITVDCNLWELEEGEYIVEDRQVKIYYRNNGYYFSFMGTLYVYNYNANLKYYYAYIGEGNIDGTNVGYLIVYGWTKTDSTGVEVHRMPLESVSLTNSPQYISAKKTFSVLPETSITPTSNNQLVNKKYVDDNIPSPIQYLLGDIGDFTSQANALDITELKAGTYFITTEVNIPTHFYIKNTHDNTTYTFDLNFTNYYLPKGELIRMVVPSDVKETQDINFYFTSVNTTNLTIGTWEIKLYIRDTGEIVFDVNRSKVIEQILSAIGEQTVYAKKTFNVLPESSVAPTTNNQLANKKYVDDAIAAAITDALEGDY